MEKVFIVFESGVCFKPDCRIRELWEDIDKVFESEDKAKSYIHELIKDHYEENTPTIEKIEDGVYYTSFINEDEHNVCLKYEIVEVI